MALNVKESMVTRAVMGASVLVLLGLGLYTAFEKTAMRGSSSQNPYREVEVCYIFTVEDVDPASREVFAWVPLPLDNTRQQLSTLVLKITSRETHRGQWIEERSTT